MEHLRNIDFRIISPNKIFDKYWEKDAFLIPCNVLEITNISKGNKRTIVIERLDFKTGKMIKHNAITYEKSLKLFEDLKVSVPFTSECKIMRNNIGYDFIVYGLFNTQGITNLLTGIDLNLSEEELNQKFHSQYKEINSWLSS